MTEEQKAALAFMRSTVADVASELCEATNGGPLTEEEQAERGTRLFEVVARCVAAGLVSW